MADANRIELVTALRQAAARQGVWSGMLEVPRVTFTKLGDFDAEVRAFREASVVTYGIGIGNYYYGIGIGNYYYLFGLDLPKDSAEAANACQLAAELVLGAFRLVNSGQ